MSTTRLPTAGESPGGPSPKRPAIFGSLVVQAARLAELLDRGENVALVGPTGCGKTTLARACFAARGGRYETAVGSGEMQPADLLGRSHFGAGGNEFRPGPLTRAARDGVPFYFDEIDDVPPDVQKLLYPLLDRRRELVNNVTGERILAGSGFAFVCSYNPPAELPPALRQRLRFLTVGYLPPEEEAALLVERAGAARDDADFLVRVAGVTRRIGASLGGGAGTGLLLSIAADLVRGASREDVLVEGLLPPLSDDPEARDAALQAVKAEGLLSTEEAVRLRLPDESLASPPLSDDDFYESDTVGDPEEVWADEG